MSDYLFDTNHASPLVTLEHPHRQQIFHGLTERHTFAICVPVLTETLFGISTVPRVARNVAEWQQLQHMFPCYAPDRLDGEVAAELQISLRRQGWQLETVDALIAAIALRYDLILLTTDKDFGAVPNLRCENWLKI